MNKYIIFPAMFLTFSALIYGCSSTTQETTVPVSVNSSTSSNSNGEIATQDVVGARKQLTYAIVDTGVTDFYSGKGIIDSPKEGDKFYGQDALYQINEPSYTDNNDGTVTDEVTGLMWQQTLDEKMTYQEAVSYAENSTLGGYDDWRIPSIKELYSLIQYTGDSGGEVAGDNMYIDVDYFDQPIGDTSIGEREIDAQTWSSTKYVGVTMNNDETVFGVNFIDGRIKGYPVYKAGTTNPNKMYFRLVRGNEEYGNNDFIDNNDGTITDLSTGLMWQKEHSSTGLDWENSLSYAENLSLAGYDDWRLPNIKELHSIVDYQRSLQTTNSAAINPIFEISEIFDMNGNVQYPYFWSSTTHLDGANPYSSAAYIAFGEAQGFMNNRLLDVHGAGAQRSDPKTGNIEDYPEIFGPQGDIRNVYNYARAVRTVGD